MVTRTTEGVTRATEDGNMDNGSGHKRYKMWAQDVQNVGTRGTECGHMSYRMWSQELENMVTWTTEVVTRATEYGHMEYRMWTQEFQSVGTRITECGHIIYSSLHSESICQAIPCLESLRMIKCAEK
jgi:hypothetical protein